MFKILNNSKIKLNYFLNLGIIHRKFLKYIAIFIEDKNMDTFFIKQFFLIL